MIPLRNRYEESVELERAQAERAQTAATARALAEEEAAEKVRFEKEAFFYRRFVAHYHMGLFRDGNITFPLEDKCLLISASGFKWLLGRRGEHRRPPFRGIRGILGRRLLGENKTKIKNGKKCVFEN